MCEHLCRENGYAAEKPEWLDEYRVCLVDATNTSKPGSSGADFRLHYLVELFDLNMSEMYLTGATEGETITRYQKLKEKDLILGGSRLWYGEWNHPCQRAKGRCRTKVDTSKLRPKKKQLMKVPTTATPQSTSGESPKTVRV